MPNPNLQLEALQQLGVEVNGYANELLDLADSLEKRQDYLRKNVATGVDISTEIGRARQVANNLHGWSKTFAAPEVQSPQNVPEVGAPFDEPNDPSFQFPPAGPGDSVYPQFPPLHDSSGS